MVSSDPPKYLSPNPQTQNITAHTQPTRAAALSKNNDLLATAGDDLKLNIWRLNASGSAFSTFTIGSRKEHNACCLTFDEGPDDAKSFVAMGCESGAVKVFDIEKQHVSKFDGHRNKVTCVTGHPFGHIFASGGNDCLVKLWDSRVQQGKPIQRHDGHTGGITAIMCTPDGRKLFTGSDDCSIQVWDLSASKVSAKLMGHTSKITAFGIHPNKHMLASSANDKVVKIWNTRTYDLNTTTDFDWKDQSVVGLQFHNKITNGYMRILVFEEVLKYICFLCFFFFLSTKCFLL